MVVRSEQLDVLDERPRTRADCVLGPRPCPWVACRHHLALDVNHTGALIAAAVRDGARNATLPLASSDTKVERFADAVVASLDEMTDTCALDVADRGETTLNETAECWMQSRERARQIEADALRRLRRSPRVKGLNR